MLKRTYPLILFILILLTITTPVTATDNNIGNIISEQLDNINSFINNNGKEPADKYETETIQIYSYKQLKEEIEKCSKEDKKSFIFNLNDGDYNITDYIICGKTSKDHQFIINGNNHVIDGNNKKKFMKLYADLKVKDLTIQNTIYNETNSSSGITMEIATDLYINNCKFLNNHANNKGSAITNRGVCYITNSVFKNNSIEDKGGAIWSTGEYGGNLTITNSTFENNKANSQGDNDRTSIIYMVSYGNNTIKDNNFIHNKGRCIHAFNQTNTEITNNKFEENTLKEPGVIRGGIIDNYEANMKITNNEFHNDKTIGELRGAILYHEIGNLEFSNNKVDITSVNPEPTSPAECSKGGVIFNRNATIKIENNEFNNKLEGNYSRGGVIYNNIGEITLINNKFNNNLKGENINGIILFNDVNSITNMKNNTINYTFTGTVDSEEDEKDFYNSKVMNDEGNGTTGIIKNL